MLVDGWPTTDSLGVRLEVELGGVAPGGRGRPQADGVVRLEGQFSKIPYGGVLGDTGQLARDFVKGKTSRSH